MFPIFSFKKSIYNYFYKSYFWLQFLKLDAESVNKKFEIICKWMRQLIVKFRPGSHQGSFGQLSVKKGLLSVITTRFLMRSVFPEFLKFWKFWGSFKDTEVYGGAGRFWEKKQKTLIPELSTPVTWPICDLQLNVDVFLFTICHFPFYHALGSFPMQNFPHFHSTLAEIWSSGTHGNFV